MFFQLNEWRDQIAAFAVNPTDPSDNILRSTGTASSNTAMTLYRCPSGATIAPTNARVAADITHAAEGAAEGAAGGAAYAPGFSASSSSTSSSSASKDAKKSTH